MNAIRGPAWKSAEPSICRRYHSGWDSLSNSSLGEFLSTVGKVPAEDHHVRPVVTDEVGHRVGAEGVLPVRSRQRRKDDVVLADLLADLPADDLQVLVTSAIDFWTGRKRGNTL